MKGGAYFDPDPKFYNKTFIKKFKAQDKEMVNEDILKMVIPKAKERGMKVFIELMEPFLITQAMDQQLRRYSKSCSMHGNRCIWENKFITFNK